MASQTNAEWITEGAHVAEYDNQFMSARVTFTTIERLTATQAVCASGNRYRLDNLRQVGTGRLELKHPGDNRVRDAVAKRTLEHVRFEVDRLCKDHRGDADDILATLNEIEQTVQRARAGITDIARYAEGK